MEGTWKGERRVRKMEAEKYGDKEEEDDKHKEKEI